MNHLVVTFTAVAALWLGLLVPACQSGPSTSSSSNWVVCDAPSDCVGVADAVDCVDGYCVDEAGERVEVEGSGGSDGPGGSGSGGVGTGGAAPGSGGGNLGGAGPASGGAGSGGTASEERPCGDALTCVPGEICRLSTIVVGPSETETYTCVSNPCTPAALDCACAAASCDLGDGRSRLCTISSSFMADILCQDQAQ